MDRTQLRRAAEQAGSIRKFIGVVQVTPDLLRHADHSTFNVWEEAAPHDAIGSTVVIDKLIVPTTQQQRES